MLPLSTHRFIVLPNSSLSKELRLTDRFSTKALTVSLSLILVSKKVMELP